MGWDISIIAAEVLQKMTISRTEYADSSWSALLLLDNELRNVADSWRFLISVPILIKKWMEEWGPRHNFFRTTQLYVCVTSFLE